MPDNINNDPNQPTQQQVQASQPQQPAAQPAASAQGPTAALTASPDQPTPNPYATARPLTTPADQPHPITGTFDKLLKYINNGPSYIDANGQPQRMQSRATLGNSILAAALAGLAQPNRYRTGAYGPVLEGSDTAAGAFNAGRQQQTEQNDAAQKASDAQQTKKLAVIANNIQTAHAYAALAMDEHKFLDETATANTNGILKDIETYDAQQSDPANKLLQGTALSFDQALAQMKGKLTRQNMIIDGNTTQLDPETGQYVVKPTYSIVNPDAKINMSEDAAAMLKKYIPAYTNAYELTGGQIKIPVSKYLADMNTYHSFQHAESYLSRADEDLGIKPADLAAAVAKNGSLIAPIRDAENAVAQGGTVADYLDRLRKAPGGLEVLKAVGLGDPNVVDAYINKTRNEQIRQNKLAQEGGIGDKAPAPPSMIADLTAAAKKLHPDQAQAIMAGINPAGLTVGEAEKIKNNILQAQNANTSNSQPTAAGPTPTGFVFNPDAPTMDSPALRQDLTKQGVKVPANFEALYGIAHNANPLTTLPPNPRKGSNQMSAQEGLAFIRQYINPNYQEGDYAAASGLSKELASTRQGTAGGTLYNAGTASQHLELLDEAAKALGNHDVQALNHLANRFGVAVGDSPAVTFKAIAEQVNGEVGKVVAGGTPHEAELAELRSNLNSDQSPEQTKKVIRAYVNLMAGRINEINDRSQQYFNRDVKGVSPTTAKVFNAYGVPAPGQVKVTLNGQSFIAQKNQVAAIQKKYPTAVIGE